MKLRRTLLEQRVCDWESNTDAGGENAKEPVVADSASTLDVVNWRPLPVYLCMWLTHTTTLLQW